MNAETPKKSGLEILKEQPAIDRIAFVLGSLDKLAKHHTEAAGGMIAATRAQADEKIRSKGKAEAYRDTIRFIGSVFGDELKDRFQQTEVPE